MGRNARTGSTPVPSTQREEFSFLSFFCGYMNVWTTTTLLLCCCLCHLTCKHVNVTNNITWLRHCPHSISASKSLCSLNGGCCVFAHHVRKNTATIASYRSTPVPSTTKLCKLLKFNTCRVFLFVNISKLVTFGHHSANR